MEFEWDNAKALENLHRHDVDFNDAIPALQDPNRLEEIDDRFDYGEERVITIGLSGPRILFVVTTLRGENTCRIISARKATHHEEDRYFTGDSETW